MGRGRLSKAVTSANFIVQAASTQRRTAHLFNKLKNYQSELPQDHHLHPLRELATDLGIAMIARMVAYSPSIDSFDLTESMQANQAVTTSSAQNAIIDHQFSILYMAMVIYKLNNIMVGEFLGVLPSAVTAWKYGRARPAPETAKKFEIMAGLCKKIFLRRSIPIFPGSSVRDILEEEDLYPKVRPNTVDWVGWGMAVNKEYLNCYRMFVLNLPPDENIAPLSNHELSYQDLRTMVSNKRKAIKAKKAKSYIK